MGDLIKGLLFVIAVFIAPVIALCWLIYRLVRGKKGNDYSIK